MQINLLEYFEITLQTKSNSVSILDKDNQYSFEETERFSKRIAWSIIHSYGKINKPIAVFLSKSADIIFADLGILYSGNFYTNLDIKLPKQRLYNLLSNIKPDFIISTEKVKSTLTDIGYTEENIVLIERIKFDNVNYSNEDILDNLNKIIDTDPCCIINTSGSTGTPKSVVLNHKSAIDFMDWAFKTLNLTGEEIIGSLSPYYFDIFTMELWLCFAKGAKLIIIPEILPLFPNKLVEFLVENKINFLFWVPTIMVNISNLDLLKNKKLNLSKVLFAGEVFPTKHFNYWKRYLPHTIFVNLYGPIEITIDCVYYIINRDFNDDEPLPIGYPCKNTNILILNEQNKECGINEYGELCVRGSSLAMGYWNNPEKTNSSFVLNPLNNKYPEFIYRTGDIVYKNEGQEIIFIGRRDFQIKHRGYRIELPEIEHIASSIPEIKNVCVVYNIEKQEIVMFYESANILDIKYINSKLAQHLPNYMLPNDYIYKEIMAMNANGKIDRNLLKEELTK